MLKFTTLFFLISCGMENTNSVQTLNSESTGGTRSNSTDEQLGFNSTSLVLTKANSKGDGIDQYVRFSRGKNKCSGVLSWEWESPNDIYLYTARHCFERSNPVSGVQWDFDVRSNSKPLIDTASGFDSNLNVKSLNLRSDNIEALSLNSQYIPSGFGKNRAENAEPTDVVRLFQYSSTNHRFKKICSSGDLVRSGFRGTFGYPNPKLNNPASVVKSVSSVEFEVLRTKMSNWLPNSKLNLSSHLVKLGETTTVPGESGSPVFTVIDHPKVSSFDCIDGILTREITILGRPSATYYNVMSFSGTSRSWSKVWALAGTAGNTSTSTQSKTSTSTQPIYCDGERCFEPTPANMVQSAATPRPTIVSAAAQTPTPKPTPIPTPISSTTGMAPGPNQVELSLRDMDSGGSVVISKVVVRKIGTNAYSAECDDLVRTSSARQSSNTFECLVNGEPTGTSYDAPGYWFK